MENRRGSDRIADALWTDTLSRVRGEFEEMPCLCLTPEKARVFFGLPSDDVSSSLLTRLTDEGFLDQNGSGEFVRRRM
jgi:hypothetical protein